MTIKRTAQTKKLKLLYRVLKCSSATENNNFSQEYGAGKESFNFKTTIGIERINRLKDLKITYTVTVKT